MTIKTWIPVDTINTIFNEELILAFVIIGMLNFIFYKVFLKQISIKRHKNLADRFRELPYYFLGLFLNFAICSLIDQSPQIETSVPLSKFYNYLCLVGICFSTFIAIRLFQISVYCYLFFANMSHGIPRLIANLSTFFFSLVLIVAIVSYLFEINLTSLATTSAAFSIILGLALQDTIGNLFAGMSLQIDQSVKIGDWIEIVSEKGNWIGQVQEITWRATYLQSFSNEIYMVPNRLMASAKVIFQMNDSKSKRLSHTFRFSPQEDFNHLKEILLGAANQVQGVTSEPPPRVILLDSMDSWISVGVYYSIEDYSKRYLIGDQMLTSLLNAMKLAHIKFQVPQLQIRKEEVL